ncbi:MAG: M1 family metallopeptidase [Myxococcales bacterium]|nr:MAG: M1 family metallopeptidase [Myxococcales bacterium]
MIGRAAKATFASITLCVAVAACGGSRGEVRADRHEESPPAGKLPDGVTPQTYRLSLTVVPQRDTFAGSAMITVELEEPSPVIWMHGERLDVTSVYATHATTRVEGTWEQMTPDGVAKVQLREPLPAGRSTLHIDYTAPFDTPLRGLYRVRSGGETYAFTQFESISARLAFPCFDEPRFKTPFEVTLTVPADEFASSNTPVDRAIALPDGLQRISFVPTPPLPTYLVAFAVGPFDVVSGETMQPKGERSLPIPIRGIAPKGKGPLLQYALRHAAPFIEELERYFGIPYPYRKLDLVAVPDFAAGAMENVGLITFREWLLLLDSERATEGQLRAFAYVMAHELAHQWFGNLVTMPWWDDIWLNEGFATWMGNKVVHRLHPEFRSDLASIASAHRAMGVDSLTNARSIRQPILTNHDIKNAFDAITYSKGGAALSMFEQWMGDGAFRDGIQLYLRRHQGRTATSSDLLAALDEVTELDVTPPFQTFLTQPGVPVLESGPTACEAGVRRIELRQQRYLPIGSSGDPERTWQIPLCVRHAEGTTCGLLTEAAGHLDLPGCPSWWMPNEEGAGYFRFSMSPADWRSLRNRGFTKLSDGGRLAVADSLYAAFGRGTIEVDGLLPWLPRFVRNPIRQLAVGPMSPLWFMMYNAASPATQPKVKAYAARLYRKRYQRLGWKARKTDSSDTKLLREAVVRFMVMDVRDRQARARAARLGRAYIGYGGEPNRGVVDPQLAGLALATAVQEGDEAFFDHLVGVLASSTDATDRNRILVALGHAESPTLAKRALELSLDPMLRRNEISRVLGTQFRNPRTRQSAWEWLKENFEALTSRTGLVQAGSAPWYATSLCTREAAEEVQAFFERKMATLAGGPRNLASAVERISLCAARAEAQRDSIDRAFTGL